MGCIDTGKVVILGNFSKARRYKNSRPKNWMDRDYKAVVPYPFSWREKIGKIECDCKEIIECYQPYYGFDFYHSDECIIIKKVKEKPQLMNLWCYSHLPSIPVAQE